jgi:hypothetical protein
MLKKLAEMFYSTYFTVWISGEAYIPAVKDQPMMCFMYQSGRCKRMSCFSVAGVWWLYS